MSLITSAATTATTTATTGVVTRVLTFVWDHTGAHVFYITDFDDNQEALATRNRELRARKVDVQKQVDYEEANQRTRTSEVDEWLRTVETTLQEADAILQAGSQQNVLRCIADCTWWTFYKLGKQTKKKLDTVDRLFNKSKFDVVANKFVPSRVQIVPECHTVGMDDLFKDAWRLLGQDDVKIMGIYGRGGVGKTTLLEKINNAFLQVDGKEFDVVILVVVSKENNIKRVQKKIGERVGVQWAENEDQAEVALRICTALSKKKFVVFLDDLCQYMDLKSIGIPIPHTHHLNSKVVFTTRLEEVCGDMGADKRFRVPVLDQNQGRKLFLQNLGREALDPELRELAMEMADECRGLPRALLTVSRAMSTKKTVPEWKRAISTLKRYAFAFSAAEICWERKLERNQTKEVDWAMLCAFWEADEKFQARSTVNTESRECVEVLHRGGSRSYARGLIGNADPVTKEPDFFTFYKDMHYNLSKGWTAPCAEENYERMVEMSTQPTEGDSTLMTTEDIRASVLGVKSGYAPGLGYGVVPSKRVPRVTTAATTANRVEMEELRSRAENAENELNQLRNQHKQLREQQSVQQRQLEYILAQMGGSNGSMRKNTYTGASQAEGFYLGRTVFSLL